jgi:hypothetical protein
MIIPFAEKANTILHRVSQISWKMVLPKKSKPFSLVSRIDVVYSVLSAILPQASDHGASGKAVGTTNGSA